MIAKLQEIHLKGMPLSRGVAIGPIFFVDIPEEPIPEYIIALEEIEGEVNRYRAAVAEGMSEIQRLQTDLMSEQNLEGAAILDAHLYILQDPLMVGEVENEIRRIGMNAEYVFDRMMKQYLTKFNAIKDPFFLDRLKDIKDVSRRLLGCLRKDVRSYFQEIPPQAIVFIRELSPSNVVDACAHSVAAFVTQGGGAASHAAIVSKAKCIPLVTSIDFNHIDFPLEGIVVIDGETGDVIINPDSETIRVYSQRIEDSKKALKQLESEVTFKTETYDGHRVQLSANISLIDEVETLHKQGGSAVGLFRSEYIFLSDEDLPNEEKQFQTYRQIIQEMRGLPIVIRVFDLGGDKYMLGQRMMYESNPFLGCRAIRFLLRERRFFKAQLKAILRARAYGDLSIMFPMVSTLRELQEAKALLKEAQLELQLCHGLRPDPVRIGCMIEVPSAAVIADILAKECDFLSIGTNDLVQYSLAVDRGNHTLNDLYTPADPSIIRLIKHIVDAANREGIPVSVCGEVAADYRFTALLLGLGVQELSVSICHMAEIKAAIRSCSIIDAVQFADRVLLCKTSEEVEQFLTNRKPLN
ncbi:MAG: phosphoenolpyruvate--protein phosphotransferase [Parachlamydiaceae bacterium]|nr:phosphoenolpyruvate--protein phosphotransferase [Parachlamydiaceae bacterium]